MRPSIKNTFVRHKFYFVSTLLLIVWLTFFDRSNLLSQVELYSRLVKIENEKGYYKEELQKVLKEEKEVLGSPAAIEKYGREKYYLKKEGETVFVLTDEKENIN